MPKNIGATLVGGPLPEGFDNRYHLIPSLTPTLVVPVPGVDGNQATYRLVSSDGTYAIYDFDHVTHVVFSRTEPS